jgi:hypothetical protein
MSKYWGRSHQYSHISSPESPPSRFPGFIVQPWLVSHTGYLYRAFCDHRLWTSCIVTAALKLLKCFCGKSHTRHTIVTLRSFLGAKLFCAERNGPPSLLGKCLRAVQLAHYERQEFHARLAHHRHHANLAHHTQSFFREFVGSSSFVVGLLYQ